MSDWICSWGVRNCTICRRTGISASEKKRLCLEAYNSEVPTINRVWLIVPYSQKNRIKKMGARWDANVKKWYADGRKDTSRFEAWKMVSPETKFPVDVFASDAFERDQLEAMQPEPVELIDPGYTPEQIAALSAKFFAQMEERDRIINSIKEKVLA